MPVEPHNAGFSFFWLVVLFVIGGKISEFVKKAGAGTQTPKPPTNSPDIEDFLRQLSQGTNPTGASKTIDEEPEPEQEVRAAPPPRPVVRVKSVTKSGDRIRSTTVQMGRQRTGAAAPPPPPTPRQVESTMAPPAPPPIPFVTKSLIDAAPMVEKQAAILARAIHHEGMQTKRVRGLLRKKETLKSAILLREIIGPPTSMARR